MTSIVGRDAELRVGDAFLADAARGPAVLLLEGEAGIGKTTVWAEVADRAAANGFTVLRARPTEAEAPLTLSALGDLLEGLPEAAFTELPDVQRRAIDGALLRGEPTGDGLQQRLLAAATRSVLVALAGDRPVLVALDDVQWLDSASAVTLGYALRRLGQAPVGVLAARRTGLSGAFEPASLPASFARHDVNLGPLSLGALHHVLKVRLGASPPRTTLVRIHQASGGHPLFALEIARLLGDPDAWHADQPLPVPATVRELVGQRVRTLPASTRALLVAVAADHEPTVTGMAVALGRDVAADVEVAAREDIARVRGGRITFTHPLFAAAIYAAATDAERRDVHGRLAATVVSGEERARHRALAAAGPDADVAAELERAADDAAGRAAPLAAAELLRIALRLTPPDDSAAIDERRLALAGHLKLAGDAAEARRVLDAVVATAASRVVRARARIALANVLYELDPGPRCSELAAAALEDAEGEPELVVHAHAMLAAVEYADRQRALHHAREAKRLLDDLVDPSPEVESLVLYVYAGLEMDDGHPIPMDAVDRALALERIAPAPVVSDRLSASLGFWLFLASDDIDGGRRWMEATYQAVLDEGDEGSIPHALSHLPLLEFAAGNWGRAEEVARQYLAASIELGHESQRVSALFALANVLAHRGREAEARPLIEELVRAADQAGSLWDLTKGQTALGALELSLGRSDLAAEHLLRADAGWTAMRDEIHGRHEADLVEALVEAGRIDEAREAAAAIDRRARRYGRHSRLAIAARSRALVSAATGQMDAAIAALDEALREHDVAPFPFDRARTQLVLGRVRRRGRERTLAKRAFDQALAGFEALGAARWAARTRAELDRVGLRRGAGPELTEGERRVAELAATGMTNREVASALFMSPKTVEVNLSRAYQKLGVRSRAELGALAAQGALEVPDRT